MLFSVEQAFVGREEIRAPPKTPAWEAREGEDLLYQDIKVLKRKKKCLEYFSKYTPRHMCNIFLQSAQI